MLKKKKGREDGERKGRRERKEGNEMGFEV